MEQDSKQIVQKLNDKIEENKKTQWFQVETAMYFFILLAMIAVSTVDYHEKIITFLKGM